MEKHGNREGAFTCNLAIYRIIELPCNSEKNLFPILILQDPHRKLKFATAVSRKNHDKHLASDKTIGCILNWVILLKSRLQITVCDEK